MEEEEVRMKVHCLFEQSGAFKNQFKALGFDAEDYDILNDFGETDHVIDIFSHIRGGYNGEPSLFDAIEKDDLVFAFFPCIRFEAKIPLSFRGESHQQKNWSDKQKLEYSMRLHTELHELYELISMLAWISIDRGIRLIVENPYTQPHYLTQYWCIKPSLIDKDRTLRGDWYKKPTQYWFFNMEPKSNFIWEAQPYREVYTIAHAEKAKEETGARNRTVARSMIHPNYANRFIREFIM